MKSDVSLCLSVILDSIASLQDEATKQADSGSRAADVYRYRGQAEAYAAAQRMLSGQITALVARGM